MFTKKTVKDALEDCQIDAIIVCHMKDHRMTVTIENEACIHLVKDILYDVLPFGVAYTIKTDPSLICNGCCFTEIEYRHQVKKVSWIQRIINKYKKENG